MHRGDRSSACHLPVLPGFCAVAVMLVSLNFFFSVCMLSGMGGVAADGGFHSRKLPQINP